MIERQAGTMLHPGAQRSEHRKTPTRSPESPMNAPMAAQRQSGLQPSAWSQHHLGASFSLARRHYSDSIFIRPDNLKLVSTFRVEDHYSVIHSKVFLSSYSQSTTPITSCMYSDNDIMKLRIYK